MLALAAQQDEANATETEALLHRLAAENSRLKAEVRELRPADPPANNNKNPTDHDSSTSES